MKVAGKVTTPSGPVGLFAGNPTTAVYQIVTTAQLSLPHVGAKVTENQHKEQYHPDAMERQYFYDESFRRPFTPPEKGYQYRPKPYLRTEQAGGIYDKKANRRNNPEVWNAYQRLPDQQVREIVKRNVPKTQAQFDRLLNRFAKSLRSQFPKDGAGEWEDVVGVWYFLARPAKPSAEKKDVWERFIEVYSQSGGERPGRNLKKIASEFKGDVARALAAVSRYWKRRVFFVSARTLADWIGVSHATAARRLNALVASQSVRVVKAGVPHLFDRTATVYDVTPLFALSDWTERNSSPSTLTRTTEAVSTSNTEKSE